MAAVVCANKARGDHCIRASHLTLNKTLLETMETSKVDEGN